MFRTVTVKFERSDHSLHEIWHGEKSTKISEQPNGNSAVHKSFHTQTQMQSEAFKTHD